MKELKIIQNFQSNEIKQRILPISHNYLHMKVAYCYNNDGHEDLPFCRPSEGHTTGESTFKKWMTFLKKLDEIGQTVLEFAPTVYQQ